MESYDLRSRQEYVGDSVTLFALLTAGKSKQQHTGKLTTLETVLSDRPPPPLLHRQ